ncbi:MAG: hypothetical protein DWQ49_13940 [Bacteroidetes bacterium]|jgi:hypothetical protein|nr:MAG: hypothetical protein DWQ49_13940 [Bacteroidota bacterium]|tara:strand:+ start:11453 stop:11692 length:240 start_codon:yes stop_codon:yes gene_type:complete
MVLPLVAVAVGGVALAGAGLAVVASIDPDETVGDKLETTLVRVGYMSEGIVKGSIVAVPTSLLVLVAFNQAMKLKGRVA